MQDAEAKLPFEEDDLTEADVQSGRMELAESHDGLTETEASPEMELAEVDGATVPVVRLIRAGVNKAGNREYTPEFLQRCVAEGRFTNSFSYLNHPTPHEKQQRPERDMRFLAAHTGQAFWSEQEQCVKAPLVFIAEDHPQSMGSLAKQQFANPVVRKRAGLSIYYDGPVEFKEVSRTVKGGQRKVAVPVRLGDARPFDVDIVTAPGAGGGFDLLEADREQEDEAMDLSTLTLEQLREARPDLIAAIQPPDPVPPAAVAEADKPEPKDDTGADLTETVGALVKTAIAEALVPLQEKLAARDKADWFENKLAECNLSEVHADHMRRAFDGKTFASEDAFAEAFTGELDHLRSLLESPRERIATLGAGAAPDGEQPETLGDILSFIGGEK